MRSSTSGVPRKQGRGLLVLGAVSAQGMEKGVVRITCSYLTESKKWENRGGKKVTLPMSSQKRKVNRNLEDGTDESEFGHISDKA